MAGTPIFAAEHEQGRSNVYMLDPRDIACDYRRNISRNGTEPAVDEELIALAESMAPKTGPGDAEDGSSGQINPVLVRMLPNRRAELVGGYRRYRAARWLQETGRCPDFRLKCTKCTLSDAEAALANMDENLQRKEPEPIQLAHAIRSLHEGYGMTLDAIGKRLRKSASYINHLLKLTGLPTQIQDAVSNGQASAAAVAELTDLPGPVAIEVFDAAKEAAGKRVKYKDLAKNGTAAVDAVTVTEGNVTMAVKSSDIRAAKRAKADAAIDSGETAAVAIKPKNRSSREILVFFEDVINQRTCSDDGIKAAKAIAGFIAGKTTSDQLQRFWDRQFIIK